MRNTLPGLAAYVWNRFVRNDLFAHSQFRLTPDERETFRQYLSDSAALGLVGAPSDRDDAKGREQR